jgi:hypothetical protein
LSSIGGRSGFLVGSSLNETGASSSSVKKGFPLQSLVALALLWRPLPPLVDLVWVWLLRGVFSVLR